MTKFHRILSGLIFFVFVIAVHAAAAGTHLKTFPLNQVKLGLKGEGRTVFQGNAIQPFPVEVLGVVPGGAPGGGDMILVRVSGALMEKNGGVSMGMSGSPVFIGDRLLGAVSITFSDSDHTLAGVTPISSMLETYDFLEPKKKVELNPPLNIHGHTYTAIDYTNTATEPDVLRAHLAITPVAIRGLTPRSYKFLKDTFAASGLEVLPFEGQAAGRSVATSSEIGKGADLKPGSSIAVQLVRGDLDISAVGTLTAKDGDKILAFGHSFFRKGNVEYLLADAPVLAILKSNNMSFKITSTGLVRGTITQDRGSAVAGRLNRFPLLVPLKIIVEDGDIGRKRTFAVKIVRDKDLLPQLILSSIVTAIDNTIDRLGPGTASMDFTLKVEDVNTVITRKNMFYSANDVSAEAISELLMALEMLQSNYLQEARVSSLEAHVKLNSNHSMAAIVSAELFDPKTGKTLASTEDKDTKDNSKDEKKTAPPEGKSKDENKAVPNDETPNDNEDIAPNNETPNDNEDIAPNDEFQDDNEDAATDDESQDDNEGIAPDDESLDDNSNPQSAIPNPQSEDSGDDESLDLEDSDSDTPEDATGDQNDNSKDSTVACTDSLCGVKRRAKHAKRDFQKVYPGQKLGLRITIRPYKKEPIHEKIFVKVPRDIPNGTAVIRIFSGMKYMLPWLGGEGSFLSLLSEDFTEPERGPRDQERGKKKKETLDDLIKKFLERDRNNDLIATITSMSAAPKDANNFDEDNGGLKDEEDSFFEETDMETPPPDRARKATDWVLFGGSALRVKVAENDGKRTLKGGKIEKSKIKALGEKGQENGENK